MKRRSFIENILLLSTTSILNANDISLLYANNIDMMELLGLKEPQLCGDSFCLRNEAFEAFYNMSIAAKKDGIVLWGSSGYRSFDYQKGIWNNKYTTIQKNYPLLTCIEIIQKITEYTSLPGTSRHHWGTDVDIVDAMGYHSDSPLTKDNYSIGGTYQYLGKWLIENAQKFDFILTYTHVPERTGFAFEPWHYSYAPLSKEYYRCMLDINLLDFPEMQKCKGIACLDRPFLKNYFDIFFSGINPLLK